MATRYFTADVFTDRMFGGNQLAVVPDARAISEDQMLAITREFNYSETSFVLPPENEKHTRRVRIFTPGREMEFAGHPTIGTAYVLAATGEIPLEGDETTIVFEEPAGPVRVQIARNDDGIGLVRLSPPKLPEITEVAPSRSALAEILSIAEDDIRDDDWVTEVASCGEPFVFVPVHDRATLGRILLDHQAWKRHLDGFVSDNLYVYAFDPERETSTARVRMFAPSLGVGEDPATGAAAAAFAGVLAKRLLREHGDGRWIVEQGFEMGRPSILHIEASVDRSAVTSVRVGGNAVMVMRGELELA